MNKKYISAWLLLWIGVFGLSAHIYPIIPLRSNTDSYTRFRNISTKDGLSSDHVLNIIQDQYNIMWFATTDGLTRYDGQRFITYHHQKESKHSLSDNLVTSLAEDIFGNLWVGTQNGLNRYDRRNDRFVPYLPQQTHYNTLKDRRVMALHADANGYLWVKTKGGILSKLDIKADIWTHQHISVAEFEGDYFYDHITEDSNHNLWIGGRNMVSRILQKGDIHQITEIPYDPDMTFFETSCSMEIQGGTLYFANYIGQLTWFNPDTQRVEHVMNLDVTARAGLSDQHETLWVGGHPGIVTINLSGGEVTRFKNNPSDPYSLVSNEIYCLYQDRQGGIWIGTDKGISFYSERLNVIQYFRRINNAGSDMSSNNITALLQDKDGLLWVGTAENGVDTVTLENGEFGNLTYSLLQHDLNRNTFNREKEVLKQYFRHKFIQSTDRKSTEEHIFGNFENFRRSPLQFNRINENKVSALYQDKQGVIYIGLWSHVGFNTYHKTQKTFKRHALWSKAADNIYPRAFEGNPFGANWYSGFLEDDQGNFWCATWEGFGLNLFDRKKGAFSARHYMPGHFPQKEIFRLDYDPVHDRIILGGTFYYGYHHVRENTYTRFIGALPANYPGREIFEAYYTFCQARLTDLPPDFTHINYIRQDSVVWLALSNSIVKHHLESDRFEIVMESGQTWRILAESADNQFVWIGTDNQLKRIHVKSNNIIPVVPIGEGRIISLYEDPAGVLWVGTENGLFFYHINEGRLSPEKLDLTAIRSITPYNQYVIVAHSKGLIWLEGRKVIKQYLFNTPSPDGLPGNHISQIYPDTDNHIWVCTNDGLVNIDPEKEDLTIYRHDPKDQFSISGNNVYAVCKDGRSRLWISTTNGLCMFDPDTKRFTDLSTPDEKTLTSRLTSCIIQDASGHIWIGTTENGISVLDPVTDKMRHYIHHEWDERGLSDNYIHCLFEDNRKNIWIGTRKGLNKYIPGEDRVIRVAGLVDHQIMNIRQDDAGYLWFSTNKGLFCMDSGHRIIREITHFPGLQDKEFSRAGCRLNDGSLAFGGKYGFNIFNPALLTTEYTPRPVVLSGFTVRDSLWFTDLNERTEIKLKYTDNSFTLSFSSADYEYGDLIRYRYRLEGFESNWNYTAPPALTAKYTNIPFGHYTCIVEASNCFGEWKDITTAIQIHILTPWYWKWWFILLFILFITGSTICIIRIREKRLVQDNIKLENMISLRTLELQETNRKLAASEEELRMMNDSKNKFFSIISHDLRNPLKALNMTTRSLHEQYDSLNETEKVNIIRIIHETVGQTGILLENLLLWVISQMDLLKPNLQETGLSALVESTIDLVELSAKKKKIRILNKIPPHLYAMADTNLLSTIFRNLISNAIHFSYPESDIIISSIEQEERIEISVIDQGVGIKPENMKRLFRLDTKIQTKGTGNEQGTGLGLIITQEFVHLQNGEIWVESMENKGSIFTFTLKKPKHNENDRVTDSR